MNQPFKILIYVALWKRPEISRACFLGFERLKDFGKYSGLVDFSMLAVISEEESRDLCEEFGIEYIYHPNEPLGLKMNEGLAACMEKPFDYLMQINSDDLISNDLILRYLPLMREGIDYFGINEIAFFDSKTGRAKAYTYPHEWQVFGCGRMFSRKALITIKNRARAKMLVGMATPSQPLPAGKEVFLTDEKAIAFEEKGLCKVLGKAPFKLWTDEKNRFLDTDSNKPMNEAGFFVKQVRTDGWPLAMDIKSDLNIWAFDDYTGRPLSVEILRDYYSKKEIDYLLTLQESKEHAQA